MRSLRESRAETPPAEPASPAESTEQAPAALGAEPGTTPEGETADLQAGKGEKKPEEKKEPDLPHWVKERLGKEKEKRERLTADLHAAKSESAKLRHLFETAVAENERLSGMLQQGQPYDARGEEVQALRTEQSVKERFAQLEQEHQQALSAQMEQAKAELAQEEYDRRISSITSQLASEVSQAVADFPMTSQAEVVAELRKNPAAEVREVAKALHEKRMALVSKLGPKAADQEQLPTTVGKTNGASRFQYDLSAKGMAAALRATRAKA